MDDQIIIAAVRALAARIRARQIEEQRRADAALIASFFCKP